MQKLFYTELFYKLKFYYIYVHFDDYCISFYLLISKIKFKNVKKYRVINLVIYIGWKNENMGPYTILHKRLEA